MTYNDLTWHHFETAAAAGSLPGDGVRRGMAGGPAGGAWVRFDVAVAGGNAPLVTAARFLAFGCPHLIAVADWVAQAAVGRAAAARLPESVQDLQQRFSVPVEKLGRLLLIEDAWIMALSPPDG